MPITSSDIKLLASQRMTDTPDGGGRMTGTVVQSGVDNNIFDDVSALDRVMGRTSVRKVFAAVLTDGTDKYLGARVILDAAPADPSVSCVLFGASSTYDTRAEVSVKLESYLAQGVQFTGALFGNHLAGQTMVMLQRSDSRQPPAVGDVLVLQKYGGQSNEVTQYVRVTEATSELAEFQDSDGATFNVRLCTCSISDPLRDSFAGWSPIKGGIVTDQMAADNPGKALLYTAVVADAAQYYGITQLADDITAGDFNIRVGSVFAPLLPSAQVETPITDARSNGGVYGLVPTGGQLVQNIVMHWSPGQNLFVGGGILPGSLSVSSSGIVVSDDGAGGLEAGGTQVGAVDYASGLLSASVDVYGGAVSLAVTHTPAARPEYVTKSVGIPITTNNRSQSYALTLLPIPARASLSVSYMSGGRWYVLQDAGNGAVRGSDTGLGAGNLNFLTGTLAVTLGALPDVGSALVLQWAQAVASPALPSSDLVMPRLFVPVTSDGAIGFGSGSKQFAGLGSMTVTWSHGGDKTATVASDGTIGGDGDGIVYGQDGRMEFAPLLLPPPGTVFTAHVQALSPAQVVGVDIFGGAVAANLLPGSISFSVNATFSLTASGALVVFGQPNRTLYVRDDAAGGLQFLDANGDWRSCGTVNYTTGVLSVSSAPTVGSSDAWGVQVAYIPDSSLDGAQKPSAFVRFNEWGGAKTRTCSIESQFVLVRYRTANGTPSSFTFTPTNWWAQAKAMGYGSQLDAVRFDIGSRFYVQSGTALQTSFSAGTGVGVVAGSVSALAGLVGVTLWDAGASNSISAWSAVRAPATSTPSSPFTDAYVVFRTATAPIRPGSFSVLGTTSDAVDFNVTAATDGKIDHARVKGLINYETGVVQLWGVGGSDLGSVDLSGAGLGTHSRGLLRTDSIRYNAVAYTYLPLDAAIVGLDPVRLPQDGRVPIIKPGRVVVIHNTQAMSPATVSNGQTISTGRTLLTSLTVTGHDGSEITTGFSKNLDAGTVTFTNVAGMSQPVTVSSRIEDEALCAETQITGDLRLTRAMIHSYPASGTWVSSALLIGDMQAAAGDAFAQAAWTNEWSDAIQGSPILAAYNQATHPIAVTNAGAITERWAIIFTSSTEYRLVGEAVGQIITGNTASVLAPVNPATGVPYFTLQPAGWGGGWSAGNVLRFNSVGANVPVWCARTVLQSPPAAPGTDQIIISVRGDIDQ